MGGSVPQADVIKTLMGAQDFLGTLFHFILLFLDFSNLTYKTSHILKLHSTKSY